MRIIEIFVGVTLLEDEHGAPGFYPLRRFGIRLPSGMIHWFETEDKARRSNYWPAPRTKRRE